MAILTKRCYFYFSIVLIGAIALVFLLYFLSQLQKAKTDNVPLVGEAEIPSKEVPIPSRPEELKEGEVGEVRVKDEETGEEKPLISPTMPSIISSTVGTVIEAKEGALIVMGKGYNFADGVPRELKCVFTEQTLTFTKDKVKYQGREGLSILTEGMEVLIGGDENIRGKAEFKVKTINILR